MVMYTDDEAFHHNNIPHNSISSKYLLFAFKLLTIAADIKSLTFRGRYPVRGSWCDKQYHLKSLLKQFSAEFISIKEVCLFDEQQTIKLTKNQKRKHGEKSKTNRRVSEIKTSPNTKCTLCPPLMWH